MSERSGWHERAEGGSTQAQKKERLGLSAKVQ
jgi:hypothetical protein